MTRNVVKIETEYGISCIIFLIGITFCTQFLVKCFLGLELYSTIRPMCIDQNQTKNKLLFVANIWKT